MTTAGTPIAIDWKISQVLETYPALLDTLIDLTPAFSRLRNPILRRVQSRLVTVEQAAGIAGLNPHDLVQTLNDAAGITTASPASTDAPPPAATARPDWVGIAPVVQSLDARPILARGEEPFMAISKAARTVPVGSVLVLEAGFEPVPLYDALGRQGFDHWSERLGNDHWRVLFHRHREMAAPASDVPVAADDDWAARATAEVTIDVRELVPPEPMMKILATLEGMPDGATLLVHHVRRPMHLYPQLDDLGYTHLTRDVGTHQVELLIHKPSLAEVER